MEYSIDTNLKIAYPGIMEKTVFSSTGRIDAAQAAQILGFQEHDIPILVSAGLLKPLGKPTQNARKFFAAVDVMEKAKDPDWLNKATQVLYSYWQKKNARREKVQSQAQQK